MRKGVAGQPSPLLTGAAGKTAPSVPSPLSASTKQMASPKSVTFATDSKEAGATDFDALSTSSTAMSSSASSSSALASLHASPAAPSAASGSSASISLDEYVFSRGGNKVIRKVLIANNGIAAVKAIRSIKRWSYDTFGSDKVISFVVMATPEDLGANAEYIRMAEEIVEVEGGTNNYNYANVRLIVDIAERVSADAVFPGWGHASENPDLPEALAKTGITWIGPAPRAMHALGDKIGSTLIAQSVGMSCMPWSGDHLNVKYDHGVELEHTQDYKDACVHSVSEAIACARRIGYPCMIKASAGGGGKGIRKVHKDEDIEAAYRQVQSEVAGPIFMMKLASNCRHLEVQLLADSQGQALALFGRDCSLQRRHQKILEEGPIGPEVAPPEVWKEMELAAVRLSREVAYVGAGTVEYLFMDDGSYCFLELNPRLQVEHPVTESIAGVNLPASMIQIAMGIPLHRIPEIRRMYGEHVDYANRIDFDHAPRKQQAGHVIACRITAENPDAEFQPTSGLIHHLNFRTTPDVWGYFSVESQSSVHEYADSQFGHLFAIGATRELARRSMVVALSELIIRGEIRTPVEYLRHILEAEDFVKNRLSTTWLEAQLKSGVLTEKPDVHVVVILGALYRAHKTSQERMEWYMDCLDRGRFLCTASDHDTLIRFSIELIYLNVKYLCEVTKNGPKLYGIRINNWEGQTLVHELSGSGLLISMNGRSHTVYGLETAGGLRLTVDGKTCLFSQEYDPSSLRSTMPGKLVRFVVADGDHLEKGAAFAEIEVMKIYIPLTVPESGRITILASQGAVLQAGDLVGTLLLDEPGRVKKAAVFKDKFEEFTSPPQRLGTRNHRILTNALSQLRNVLAGYTIGAKNISKYLSEMMNCLRDPRLPAQDFDEVISRLMGRIPDELFAAFERISSNFIQEVSPHRFYWEIPKSFPTFEIQNEIDNYLKKLPQEERATVEKTLETVSGLVHKYRYGNHTYAISLVKDLIQQYLSIEQLFSGQRPEVVISGLRKQHRKDLKIVADVALSHFMLPERNDLMTKLMDIVENQLTPVVQEFTPLLRKLTSLSGQRYAPVVLKARKILMMETSPAFRERKIYVDSILRTVMEVRNGAMVELRESERVSRLSPLINDSQELADVLFSFLFTATHYHMQAAALEVYIRRIFRTYRIANLSIDWRNNLYIRASWDYFSDSSALNSSKTSRERYLASFTDTSYLNTDRAISPSSAPHVGSGPTVSLPSAAADSSASSSGAGALSQPQPVRRVGSFLSRIHSQPELKDFAKVKHTTTLPSIAAPDVDEDADVDYEHLLRRHGTLCFYLDFDSLKEHFSDVLRDFSKGSDSPIGSHSPRSTAAVDDAQTPSSQSQSWEHSAYRHTIHVGFIWSETMGQLPDDEHFVTRFKSIIDPHVRTLRDLKVRNVCFVVAHGTQFPLYFTFRHRKDYQEDDIIRHIEPPMAAHLEISRLSNFRIRFLPTKNRMVHLFEAIPKDTSFYAKDTRSRYDGRRFYARVLIRQVDSLVVNMETVQQGEQLALDAFPEPEAAFVEALNAIESAIDGRFNMWRFNNVYMNCLVDAHVEVKYVKNVIRALTNRYRETIRRLAIHSVEIRLDLRSGAQSDGPVRFVCSNPTGHVLQVLSYAETIDPRSGELIFKYIGDESDAKEASLDGKPVLDPYPTQLPFQKQREIAAKLDTVYVYDYPTLFERALTNIWKKHAKEFPEEKSPTSKKASSSSASSFSATSPGSFTECEYLDCVELILPEEFESDTGRSSPTAKAVNLREFRRAPAQNKIGMVAWKMRMRTPEYPQGRDVVVIANDVTHQVGTFGIQEDTLFARATQYARERRIPRLYLSTNSGARINLAKEVLDCFKVAWTPQDSGSNRGRESSGSFDYLYVTEDDFRRHSLESSIVYERLEVPRSSSSATAEQGGGGSQDDDEKATEVRYRIMDIVGKQHGLSVENLSGSGMIAHETSGAYEDIFTLSYVSGRSVGIGAYLVRLGQRIIQKVSSPIILTGFNALNKVLGRTVYTSNLQLGGVDIMHPSGVTHITCQTDLEGIAQCLKWLSFVPASNALPRTLTPSDGTGVYESRDLVARDIEFSPLHKDDVYDPRSLVDGVREPGRSWVSGFFDQDSWVETLEGWARTVVVGRARLGGIPMGAVCVETRAVEGVVPADPASPDGKEQLVAQAGQVWYPDSAAKTAQSIRDMNGEKLPLMIFANWRGFSGGMRDMFGEILKFGAQIVDALREYEQPIFVYLPPYAELRGGAWVVVDSTINPKMIEMYAAPEARGGVLEPAGVCDVKFKKPNLVKLARRLDSSLVDLCARRDALEAKLAGIRQQVAAGSDSASASSARSSGTRSSTDNSISTSGTSTPPTISAIGPNFRATSAVFNGQHSNGHHGPRGASSASSQSAAAASAASRLRSMPGYVETERELTEVKKAIADREKKMIPLYHQIALAFVGLHDTPGRMHSKGVIRGVVPWRSSRKFFYWRLRRRQLECHAIQRMLEVDSELAWADAKERLRNACVASLGAANARDAYDSDEKFVAWISATQRAPTPTTPTPTPAVASPSSSSVRSPTRSKKNRKKHKRSPSGRAPAPTPTPAPAPTSTTPTQSEFETLIAGLRASRVQRDVTTLYNASPAGALQGLLDVFDKLTPEQTAIVRQKLGLA